MASKCPSGSHLPHMSTFGRISMKMSSCSSGTVIDGIVWKNSLYNEYLTLNLETEIIRWDMIAKPLPQWNECYAVVEIAKRFQKHSSTFSEEFFSWIPWSVFMYLCAKRGRNVSSMHRVTNAKVSLLFLSVWKLCGCQLCSCCFRLCCEISDCVECRQPLLVYIRIILLRRTSLAGALMVLLACSLLMSPLEFQPMKTRGLYWVLAVSMYAKKQTLKPLLNYVVVSPPILITAESLECVK